MTKTRTEGLEAFRNAALQRLPKGGKEELIKACEKSADEFIDLVGRIIPRDPTHETHLADTLTKEPLRSGAGFAVSIGDEAHPYPLHLEGGHLAPDGSHVPPVPFWNAARHKVAKRHKGRASRAIGKVIKIAFGGG